MRPGHRDERIRSRCRDSNIRIRCRRFSMSSSPKPPHLTFGHPLPYLSDICPYRRGERDGGSRSLQ
jgi:hypothetical protein